jgi:lysophospholipase L1-like esterase
MGDARAVEVEYQTETTELGYRGPGAGQTFALWRDGDCVDEQPAVAGTGTIRLDCGPADGRWVLYLPEGMRPTVLALTAVDGRIEPAPAEARWIAYGDSVAEGWIASGPSGAWPAVAGRQHGLDVCNLGYAGSARGEIPSAEQIAKLSAEVISISHGTNCWTRIPFSADMMQAGTTAFLEIVRQGHPATPIVVASPILRPDAESTPNRLGASLGDLREAVEEATRRRIDGGDARLWLVAGRDLIGPELLADGIHPNDEGHRVLARVIGGKVAEVLRSSPAA